ncbi:MAG: hypothetical protein PWP65_2104 [Clostridia bacterium]|jgi:hypothetical protein|nr:hypothetical protein [Clostridia bacterium]
MLKIYDEDGNVVDALPTRIHFEYVRELAARFASGADPDCLRICLEVLGLDGDEADKLLEAALATYQEEGDAYQAFIQAAHEAAFVEVTP